MWACHPLITDQMPNTQETNPTNEHARCSKKNCGVCTKKIDPDPRHAAFLANYLDPKSPTYTDCKNSALKAGFGQKYAEMITSNMPDWFKDAIGDSGMVALAEKRLNQYLENEPGTDTDKRIQADTAKFVAERLRKEKWSSRTEHTGAGGGAIEHRLNDEDKKKLDALLDGNDITDKTPDNHDITAKPHTEEPTSTGTSGEWVTNRT